MITTPTLDISDLVTAIEQTQLPPSEISEELLFRIKKLTHMHSFNRAGTATELSLEYLWQIMDELSDKICKNSSSHEELDKTIEELYSWSRESGIRLVLNQL